MATISENIPLNFAILKQPENWIILTLMVSIVLLGMALIFHDFGDGANVTS